MASYVSRRTFLGSSTGLIGTTLAAASGVRAFAAPATTPGRSTVDKFNVGCIGLGGQGSFLLSRFQANPRVRIAALCDCFTERTAAAAKRLPQAVETYQDFRRVLDRSDIDAVVIGAPDHWHCLMSILACQASKDVYVEKPLSLCIDEGRQLVRHVRHERRIVQVGLMQRSGARYQEAVDVVRSGQLGKVSVVRAWNVYNRLGAKLDKSSTDQPAGLDWELWTGPRPLRPFNPAWIRGGFRWIWDFGGGNITDRGTHMFDTILQAMNADYPKRISATGGKFVLTDKNDPRETPDTLNVLYDFGDWTLHYEAREANHRVQWPSGYGFAFFGSKASLFVDRGGYRVYRERSQGGLSGEDRVVGTPGEGKVTGINELFDPHIENFVECVATRKTPVCDVEVGHRSTNVSHLGNIAYHTKRTIDWDGAAEVCRGDDDAQALTHRDYRKPWTLPRVQNA
jgi:predicted dehydrogenase